MEESLATYRARLDGAVISTYVLALFCVSSKMWCRRKTSGSLHNLGWDDILSIIALLWASVFFLLVMVGLRPQLGRHSIVEVSLEQIVEFRKVFFAVSLTYVCSIAFIKFAILGLYWKLFSIASRTPIAVMIFLTAAWFIALLCLGAFGCMPIRAQWDPAVTNPKCLNPKAIYLGGSLPNVIMDFILVIMPLPYVWRLHMSVGLRVIVAGMFALGFFICIVSIIRLTILMSLPAVSFDITYDSKDFILWSTVEINIGLVCSCLPSLRPMLRLISPRRLFSTGHSSNATPGLHGNNRSNGDQGGASRSRTKGSASGLFTTIIGRSQFDSGEDVLQMINRAHISGDGNTEIETGRTSSNGDGNSTRETQNNNDGILVSQNWSVSVDERPIPHQ